MCNEQFSLTVAATNTCVCCCNGHIDVNPVQSNNVELLVTLIHDKNGEELQGNAQFTQPVPQQAAKYPVNHTGAYHYVVQVFLNNFSTLLQTLIFALENNGFGNDKVFCLSLSMNFPYSSL